MQEISLHILDIAVNSVRAGADRVRIFLDETPSALQVIVSDNGCGMCSDFLRSVTDPFCTSRVSRKVGMGIPLMKSAAERTGGSFTVVSRSVSESATVHGTEVRAIFLPTHIDCAPLGDIVATLTTLIQGSPHVDYRFRHLQNGFLLAELDLCRIRQTLGKQIPANTPEVLHWISEFLREQYERKNYHL